tara:strand:- start:1 stop:345 length:345 start_codon:yes stop_codon:yes gene_type:complete
MTNYTEVAEKFLSELLEIKERKAALDRDQKLVEHKLSAYFAQGDLNHLKVEGKDFSLKYKDTSFTFSPGKKTFDYSKCKEIRQKEAELKALKQTAQSIGLASQKTGTPYWIVRS